MNEQILALAAICQAAYTVQQIARKGELDDSALTVMLSSITNTSPERAIDVYGGDISALKPGLQTIVDQLGNDAKIKDPEITRYIVSLIALERQLAKRSKQLNLLGERIEQAKRQLGHYELLSDTLLNSFASIYSDIISPIGSRIQVAGEPEVLKQPTNQHKIRAVLLAGIRAAVLWRQVGGKRRTILFSRGKIVDAAKQQLNRI
ncbi:high frequency lysogenization protein HflD [Endozoicomonas sp. G2_1]|uniref:high frequency lysogenization protein HflD n=1 Tax=Endozoicomonas sp. G2_1 TaxID=2821091 RepID=UPI001ADC20DC|nr:high frequency lysogenization protein HflD [Endozoicomonas sp. G2_1]MBO9490517.1 high frequency lysogenization protein HflD [Endozoicomonas sp. G2_1]